MNKANFNLTLTTPQKRLSPRSLLIEDIYKLYDTPQEENLRITYNKKKNKNVKKLTPKQVAVKLSKLNHAELESFYGECKRKAHQGWSIGSFILYCGLK